MAVGYEGYGRISLAGVDENSMEKAMVGASSLAIAASLWAMLDPWRARDLFSESARWYHRLGNPFFVALAVCGEHADLVATAAEDAIGRGRQEPPGLIEPD